MQALRTIFGSSLPELAKKVGETERIAEAFGRYEAALKIRNQAERLAATAAAFPERSELRQSALEGIVAEARKITAADSRLGYCARNFGALNEVSPDHAERLVEIAVESVERNPIENDGAYKAVFDLASQLSQANVLLDVRDGLSRKLRAYERFRDLGKKYAELNKVITNAEKHLSESPKADEDFARVLEDHKSYSVTLQDDDGEWDDYPAFDGERICVGDGDDMVEFWGGLGVVLDALRELLSAVDLEEVAIDWDRCPFHLFPEFEDFAWGLASWDAYFERFLDEHNLADIDSQSWGGDAPGRSGVWIRVWMPEDRLVAVLRDLWAAYRFAASVVVPELNNEIKSMVS